jgi:hypothetical protein
MIITYIYQTKQIIVTLKKGQGVKGKGVKGKGRGQGELFPCPMPNAQYLLF